ncbi:RraA family protein [Dyadobacter sp. CY261]|uniref:RraA family protein n=1 Tax=Dyadobacter sp. CY261 TaxID=2907203 RepID=UPI001F24E013|nr:RraA family protein [Dyadobacter sp. CY261]MCF0069701.1 RraA family protein [Dyadobacter sp. CY261]
MNTENHTNGTQSGSEQYRKEVGMMNLERFIAERETISDKPFPIPDQELLSRFEQLYTGAVNDVLREFCLLHQALPNRIVPLREYRTVAGLAFTVKSAPNAKITGEMEFRTQMLDAMHENAFVVWDSSKDEQATMWGGVMTATAKNKGIKAACLDGGIRDTHQILEADFPVFYKYRISNGSLGRCLITHFQTVIQIDDVTIKPGDVVLGDIDGVLIVPRDIAYEVLLRAEEIRENEKQIFGWVHNGESIQTITERGGYF